MATIPTGTILAAQRCREVQRHQKLASLRSEPIGIAGSPIGSPECTPPASPRKTEFGVNTFAKLYQLIHPRSIPQEGEIGAPGSPRQGVSHSKFSQLLHHRSVSHESDMTSPPMSPTSPGLDASHSNLSPIMHHQETSVGGSASGQTQSLEASHHTSSITSMT
ncbi:uncharacterized protein LOC121419013 [Lytechinus variegatus]|uniref:uncharacterized protein LOC121419013 n=1 Tax=Lytechinus variegatus TaxID=7654 RepID=UPI001BB29244|nr:uncharacterized protein LOC121419013 [Lytechinus variegatus]XP_041469217.1 uncharacterized protein LOC121419013 [Lytechinus variegatus]XP_041469225.1 uncharacterized protein LOC121419013 [Lytechinus variegatus]XP_041469236.1 uncharacterized protein LOC121419013 [Lytechinus variegatus]